MAVYPPPSFYSGIFDTNAFAHGNDNAGLTEDEANLLYYKYPVGQSYETLQQTDHTGLATFQAGIDLNAGTLTFPDATVQTTAFTGAVGASSLSATLLVGNSAGSTDINMNNNDITNCATVSGLQLSTGVLATNINIGTGNLNLTTTGNGHNIFIGDGIANNITTGNYNTMLGSVAGQEITTALGNEGVGSSALQNLTTGQYNSAMGNRAGEKLIGGGFNVMIGAQARQNGTIGDYNTAIGQASGQQDTGSYNTYIGSSTSITGGVSNSTVVGFGATTGIAHTIQLGRASVDNVNCPNTLSVAGIITNTVAQPVATDSSTKVPTTAWVQSAISAVSGATTTTLKYTASQSFTTPTGCRFIDIMVVGYGGNQGVSDVGPPVFYGGAGSGGNMALITGFAITAGTTLTLDFNSTSTTGYVSISYTGASVLTNIAKVYNGNAGGDGSQGSGAPGGTVNTTASLINSRSAPAYVYNGTAGLASTVSGGGSTIPPATAGTGTSCPNGVFTYSGGVFGCGGTGNTNKGGGVVVITYHLGV